MFNHPVRQTDFRLPSVGTTNAGPDHRRVAKERDLQLAVERARADIIQAQIGHIGRSGLVASAVMDVVTTATESRAANNPELRGAQDSLRAAVEAAIVNKIIEAGQ